MLDERPSAADALTQSPVFRAWRESVRLACDLQGLPTEPPLDMLIARFRADDTPKECATRWHCELSVSLALDACKAGSVQ